MPTLNWIGKEDIENHDKEVPFKLLKKIKSASYGKKSQNQIIHGDNLEALKALMPFYRGKIKCIYIDPPYNTGKGDWIYSDRVDSPKIKKWFKKNTPIDYNDLCRHDKWLCMIYPRLKLLKELLSPEGIIFISIDDNEKANLKSLLDGIFSEKNFITTMIWKSRSSLQYSEPLISSQTEYVLAYAKNKKLWGQKLLKFNRIKKDMDGLSYSNPDNDPRGKWVSSGLIREDGRKKYTIKTPSGKEYHEAWLYTKKNMMKFKREGLLWFGKKGDAKPRKKSYWKDYSGRVSTNLLQDEFIHFEDKEGNSKKKKLFTIGTTEGGTKELKKLFGTTRSNFDYPKPFTLIKYLLSLYPKNDFITLDSFAGTGTTGHAVMDLNKEDGGNRKFILIEMEDGVAKPITAERIKRASERYDYGGGFEFCELGKPLFDEFGSINKECSFKQLAAYVYFTETQTNIDNKKIKNNYIGSSPDEKIDYYLIFKEKYKNKLSKNHLKNLKKNQTKKIIYADKCLLSEEELEEHNIEFKQIPYEVEKY